MSKIPLRKDVIIGTILASILKCVLRYLLMAAYLYACAKFGLYDHGLVVKLVVTLTSFCVSRWVLREIGRMFWNGVDEPIFNDIGIIACIRDIKMAIDRW